MTVLNEFYCRYIAAQIACYVYVTIQLKFFNLHFLFSNMICKLLQSVWKYVLEHTSTHAGLNIAIMMWLH